MFDFDVITGPGPNERRREVKPDLLPPFTGGGREGGVQSPERPHPSPPPRAGEGEPGNQSGA